MLNRSCRLGALLAVLAITACANAIAWSHAGGLAADGCHRVADTDTRHAHAEGTADPTFICVDEDSGTVKIPLHTVTSPATEPTIENLTETIAAQALGLASERDDLRARICATIYWTLGHSGAGLKSQFVHMVIYLTETVVLWWFGTRKLRSPDAGKTA